MRHRSVWKKVGHDPGHYEDSVNGSRPHQMDRAGLTLLFFFPE